MHHMQSLRQPQLPIRTPKKDVAPGLCRAEPLWHLNAFFAYANITCGDHSIIANLHFTSLFSFN